MSTQQENTPISAKVIGIVFISIGILQLLSFIIVYSMKDWVSLTLFIIFITLGLIVRYKWGKMFYWLKWATVFICLQILLSSSIASLTSFLYARQGNDYDIASRGEIILFKTYQIVSYPSNLYERIRWSTHATKSGDIVAVTSYRWEVFLKFILNTIYAGLIGALLAKLTNRFKFITHIKK